MRKPRQAGSRNLRTTRDERRRTYGQNFIRSERVVRELVAASGAGAEKLVVEVGAGAGAITRELARRGARVIALELDPAWAEPLRELFAERPAISVVQQDVLSFTWPREPFQVIGNIPFGITTPILHALLDDLRLALLRADLIVQHEVARKRAVPGRSTVLSLSWEPWFSFTLVHRIPAAAFSPVPASDAAHLAIERRSEPLLAPAERGAYVRFVRDAFARGGRLRAGLRTRLTNNQVRALRSASAVPFTEQTLCNSLGARAWVSLYRAAQPYL
jgi:23S rRNA (adenine-N6)-dimethyltransferase